MTREQAVESLKGLLEFGRYATHLYLPSESEALQFAIQELEKGAFMLEDVKKAFFRGFAICYDGGLRAPNQAAAWKDYKNELSTPPKEEKYE